ncbi:MAG: hypothetical protein RLZZ214_142, partial [Verrucomicrobiota bacterium]
MRKRTRIVVVIGLLAVAVAGISVWVGPLRDEGIVDDRKDVDLENVIAFAERANAAYHEAKVFRYEYGAHVEAGEFPASGLRIYVDSKPGGDAQWVILRGTANMPNIFDDLDFVDRDEHELGIHVHAGFDDALQECLPWLLPRLDSAR